MAERGERVTIGRDGKKSATRFADAAELQKDIRNNDWNEYVIEARGPNLRHTINGKLMSETTDNDDEKRADSGILALQLHTGPPMVVTVSQPELRSAGRRGSKIAAIDMAVQSHILIDADESIVRDGVVAEGRPRVDIPMASADANLPRRPIGRRARRRDRQRLNCASTCCRRAAWASGACAAAKKRSAGKSPVRGPVHPSFVPLFDPSGLGWLEGFDELLCRCGLESNGAPDFDEHRQAALPAARPHRQFAGPPRGTDSRRSGRANFAPRRRRRIAVSLSQRCG